MTNEEVSKRIEGLKNRCERLAKTVNYEVWCKDVEACEAALSAIRAATAHIDLEAWEPCDVCEEYKAILFGGYRTFEDAAGTHRISKPNISGGARFCPCCGRPLLPGALEELEKRLRGFEK